MAVQDDECARPLAIHKLTFQHPNAYEYRL